MDTPKAVSPSFSLSLYPRTDLKDCHTSLQKKLSSQWGDPKEGGWRWGNPVTRRHGTQSTLQSSSSPETPPSFGGTRVGSAAGGSPGSGDCGLMQRGIGCPSPWGGGWGAVCLANPPQRPQPQDSPAWGRKPAQTPGMWHQPRSPRPDGNRASSSFLFFRKMFLNCSLQVTYIVVACTDAWFISLWKYIYSLSFSFPIEVITEFWEGFLCSVVGPCGLF